MALEVDREEYELLLKQREQLIQSIWQTTKSFHTAVFSSLTALSAVLAVLFQMEVKLSAWYLFLSAQLVIGLFFFVAGLLFSANCDRDYIRAIDVYLRQRYQVRVPFYQGELSYRHINHPTSPFAKLTTFGGVTVVLLLACSVAVRGGEIWKLALEHPFLSGVVAVELSMGAAFILWNFYYKLTGRSPYYKETLEFFQQGRVPPLPRRFRRKR